MRYFYDCEFIEDGRTIDLISIGIVAEDGREYYAVNAEIIGRPELYEQILRSEWLMENVIPHIMSIERFKEAHWPEDLTLFKQLSQMREEVEAFLGFQPEERYGILPELWGWYSTYDHIALNQLWGAMLDKPPWLPWITHDIASLAHIFGITPMLPGVPKGQHHALTDAKWHRDMFVELQRRMARIYQVRID